MASNIGKKILKNQVNKRIKKAGNDNESDNDNESLWYVYRKDKRGKMVKIKKDFAYYEAKGVPKKDIAIFLSVRKRAKTLDSGLSFFGIGKFGWGAVLGAIPVVGDFADTTLAWLFVVRKAAQVSKGDDKAAFISKMHFYLIVGGGVGMIPMFGDVVDAIWKTNNKSARMLERLLLNRAAKAKELAEKEAHAPLLDHRRVDAYHHPDLDHRQPHRYETEPAPRVPVRYESDAAPGVSARHDTRPAANAPPKYEEQYGNIHERLGMKAGKESTRKPQAQRSGGSWFGGKKGRKDQVQNVGAGSADVTSAYPVHPEGPGHRDGWI